MRAAHRAFNPGTGSKSVLAGLMALLLVVGSTLSVSHSWHKSLHRDGALSGHLCLVCSLAKGHASGPEAALALTSAAMPVLFYFCLLQSSPLPRGFDYRVAHGRAPPIR